MEDMSPTRVLSEEEAFELLVYLITSALGCVDEPRLYGSFRLIDAASKLIGFAIQVEDIEGAEFLRDLKQDIDKGKLSPMSDEKSFVDLLEDATHQVARELKRRDRCR